MAKASERKGVRTEELECCGEERRRQLESIRLNFVTFPVIRAVPCPACRMVLKIKVYERPTADATA